MLYNIPGTIDCEDPLCIHSTLHRHTHPNCGCRDVREDDCFACPNLYSPPHPFAFFCGYCMLPRRLPTIFLLGYGPCPYIPPPSSVHPTEPILYILPLECHRRSIFLRTLTTSIANYRDTQGAQPLPLRLRRLPPPRIRPTGARARARKIATTVTSGGGWD